MKRTLTWPEGMSLPYAFIVNPANELIMAALDLPPDLAYQTVLAMGAEQNAVEIAFALDYRWAEGQGLKRHWDFLAGFWYREHQWTPFIIEYGLKEVEGVETLTVDPVNYDNAFWNAQLKKMLAATMAKLIRRVHSARGTPSPV